MSSDAEQANPASQASDLAGDVLMGADAIAKFLGFTRRQVYAHIRRRNIPFFRMGSVICMRRSKLILWIEEQEAENRRKPVVEEERVPAPTVRRRGRRQY